MHKFEVGDWVIHPIIPGSALQSTAIGRVTALLGTDFVYVRVTTGPSETRTRLWHISWLKPVDELESLVREVRHQSELAERQ